jgi:hypothetical protein
MQPRPPNDQVGRRAAINARQVDDANRRARLNAGLGLELGKPSPHALNIKVRHKERKAGFALTPDDNDQLRCTKDHGCD